MGQHDTLGISHRSGGVTDGTQVLGLRGHFCVSLTGTRSQPLHVRKGNHFQATILRPLKSGRPNGLYCDHCAKGTRTLVQYLIDFKVILHQHHRHVRLGDDEGTGVLSQRIVERHNDQGVAVGSLFQQNPFRPILRVNPNERSWLQSQANQAGAEIPSP